MEKLQLGSLTVRTLGSGQAGAVLLCHGYGAPGDDLVPLAEVLDPDLKRRWFFPEAPKDLRAMGIPGRAWWDIDIMRLQLSVMSGRVGDLFRETPAGMPEAARALTDAIAAIEKLPGISREKLVIGGFSQGAMLTTEVALHAEKPFAGLCILSGALVSEPRWREASSKVGAALHAFQSHGTADPILPFGGAVRLREVLQASGASLDFVQHDGGHEIPMGTLKGMHAFLNARLGPV
ncbi:MAG: dienelactone hydrolase family protein [Deltaproteobacteria bacterium]|nr:dienelactone hydrolase family protein [Deltaproteobacteria bacterium]